MVKTTIYLTQKLKLELERAAREEGKTEAEILREALETALRSRERPRPRLPLFKGGLGDSTACERVDELLRGGFGS